MLFLCWTFNRVQEQIKPNDRNELNTCIWFWIWFMRNEETKTHQVLRISPLNTRLNKWLFKCEDLTLRTNKRKQKDEKGRKERRYHFERER